MDLDKVNITLPREEAETLNKFLDDFRYFLTAVYAAEEDLYSRAVIDAVDDLRMEIDSALKE